MNILMVVLTGTVSLQCTIRLNSYLYRHVASYVTVRDDKDDRGVPTDSNISKTVLNNNIGLALSGSRITGAAVVLNESLQETKAGCCAKVLQRGNSTHKQLRRGDGG